MKKEQLLAKLNSYLTRVSSLSTFDTAFIWYLKARLEQSQLSSEKPLTPEDIALWVWDIKNGFFEEGDIYGQLREVIPKFLKILIPNGTEFLENTLIGLGGDGAIIKIPYRNLKAVYETTGAGYYFVEFFDGTEIVCTEYLERLIWCGDLAEFYNSSKNKTLLPYEIIEDSTAIQVRSDWESQYPTYNPNKKVKPAKHDLE